MSSEENISPSPEVETEEKTDSENPSVFKKPLSPSDVEKEQEAQLRSRYPALKPNAGGSALLQKRLSKPKYFDSGDYAMAKAKKQPLPQGMKPPPAFAGPVPGVPPTGDEHPTPETVHARKTSLVQNKLLTRLS